MNEFVLPKYYRTRVHVDYEGDNVCEMHLIVRCCFDRCALVVACVAEHVRSILPNIGARWIEIFNLERLGTWRT